MWPELYASCEVDAARTPGYAHVPKPDERLLDEFEQEHRFRLPRSYRGYAAVFGAGELAGFYRIATPLPTADEYELGRFNRDLHGDPAERLLDSYGPPAVIDHFRFFCADGGGYFYGWKTDEVTDPAAAEYAIYEFPRYPKLRRVAGSFAEFVTEFILRPDEGRGWAPERRFWPFQVPA